jgi:hypothetical protein
MDTADTTGASIKAKAAAEEMINSFMRNPYPVEIKENFATCAYRKLNPDIFVM